MNDLIGTIVVIKRNGADGPQFPLRTNKCLFGRKPECDIRIQLPNVSLEHAVVKVDNDRKIKLINLSSCNQTLVNGKPISQVEVQHLDVFTISDRSFRFEFPSPVQKQAKENSPKTQRLRSSSTGNTPQENKTPRMPTPKGSPRTPPTGGSLKENIYRLRRHSMPLQEEEEVLASPGIDKKPFSMIAVNCEPQEKNDESAKLVSEKRKSAGGESKTKRNSKRVSFGPVLSPEQFDKELPPDTPVRRGATPRRASKAGDHSFIQLCSSSKKRRSVIASPQTESITEEDDSQDSSENKTPKTQAQFSSKLELTEQGQVTHEVDIHELTSQQCGMPKGRGQPSPQLDTMILGCTEQEGVIPKSPTPEKYTTSSKRMESEITESVAMEAVLKDTPESRRQFRATQATPKSVTPKHSRRSSCRIAEKNCVSAKKDRVSQDYAQSSSSLEEDAVVGDAGPAQAAPETYTPQTSRRSSMRLAGNSPSLLEVRSVDEVQSKVTPHPKTVSLSHSVEENIDETILDSDDYTSDEEDGEREMAIGNNKPTRLATPLRKEIEEGVKLHKTKKKMVTPLKKEIIKGKQLKPTKKSLPTPLKKAISSAVTLRQTKRRLPTPLKEEIKRGVQLQKAKKSLPTPLKEEIKRGVQLQKANKSLPTPLRRQLEQGVSLKQTGKSLKRKRSESSAKDNEPKRLKPSSSQQCGTPKGRGQSLSQLDTMILECTKEEGVIPKSPTPEKFTTFSERVKRKITESVAMEAVLKDTPESRKQFRATQATPKSVTPKHTRRSSSRMAEKNCVSAKKDSVSQYHGQSSSSLEGENVGDAGPNQTVLKTYTPQTSRRSSVGLAGNSPSLREVRSVDEKQSKVTPHSKSASLSHSVEENMDETILDSDDCTSDEEDGDREMAIGTDKPTRLATPLRKEIEEGVKLQKTKKKMVTPLKKEIIKGKQLKPTKKSLPTPLKKAISSAVTLRQTKRRLPTPLKEEIKRGVQLQKAKKSLPTPLRRQLEQGVSLKQTGKSLKRKRTESSAKDNEPSMEVNEIDEELDVAPARRALKTPLRKAISAGIRLRKTRHRMATPLRKQIHSKHTLRAVRRKSTVITARKPTYAEIVKRHRKTVTEARRVSRGSCKFRNMVKGSSKATLSAKITDTDVQSLEIEKVQVNDVQLKGRRNNTSLARKSTPQTKSTKLTDSQGTPSFRKRNCWMSSLARATNGVKTRAMSIENLEGLSEMFTTPPAVQMTNNNVSGEKHSGNWLSSLAKATFGSRKRGMPVEDLQGVPEMFATPPSANTGSDCNRRSSMKSLPSTDEEAMVQIMNVAPLDTLQVRADAVSPDKPMLLTESLEPTKTPSLRSSGVHTTQIEIVSPVNSSRTPSLRSGRKHTVKSAVTPRAIIEIGEVLKPNKTPSLRNSAEDAVTIQVVTPVQPSRTPSLRSATTQPCTQNSERPGLEVEIVQAIAPSRTPSMRSAAETKAVLRKSIGNSTKDPKTVDLQEPTPRLMKSPKPQPKRYSRKSEGLQGVARLLRTPDAESDLTGDSPKLDGIKAMMQLEKSLASPHFAGLKTLMKTPKISERHMDPKGYFSAELFASPVQDLSQDTTQSVAHEKRSESVMEQTSSKAEATRLMKSPKESNSIESVENFFVPNMFASPKPQPKRYSRKSEGLQGVARLLRTPDAENDFTEDSPKLDGIKSMMQLEKSLASPHFVGLKTLMKTPKISERHMDPEGYFSAELFASPVQELTQDTTQSVADEKRSESVIEPTSSKADATTTARSGNIVSETPPRTTRSRRKAPEDSVEPVPKRVRRTRATVKQQNEGKTETRSNSKAAQKKTAVKSQKKTAAVIQDTPKPFVFKRTKLDPIIEVQSPLPTLDDAIEITTSSSLYEEAEKASNEERKTGNAPKTRKQSNAPLRSSRRGNRCKAPAETPVEEFTREKVAEQHLVTRRKKTETVAEDSTNTGDSQKAHVKTQEPKGERKRATRNNKANENSLDTIATKTRMTRNQRAEIADLEEEEVNCSFIDEAVINPAPRRARSVAKTAKKNVQVLGKSKPTRSTDREETHDEAADYVPEVRFTRASRKQANESKVVENDNLARNTRGKNKGKEEVKELKKEETTNAIKQPRGTGSARRTRGNSAQKADIEGHDGSLTEEKEVRPDKSSNKPRAKREVKQSTTNASRETRSTRSRKPAEDKVDFTEQSVHSKVGTNRSRQENAGTPPPEPKRTRASVRAQSGPNTRITRSTSRK